MSGAPSGGADDEIQIEIPIGLDDVGRVIGKAGVHIRLVRERSKCQIEMVTAAGGPFVRVKGHPKRVEIAKKLISDVAGGSGVVFIRDLTDAAYSELTNGGWLQNEANAAGVTAEQRCRGVRISCSNPNASHNFKQLVEKRIADELGLSRSTVECATVAAANAALESLPLRSLIERFELRVERRMRSQGRCMIGITGPPAVVREAEGQVKFWATNAEQQSPACRHCVPFWSEVLGSGCSNEKLADLRADINEAVALPFGVSVNLQRENQLVTIDGECCVEAAAELRAILQYYFHNSCALVCLPAECLELYAVEIPHGSPDLAIQRLPQGHIWLSGVPAVVASESQKLCRAALQWQCTHTVLPLPHANLVPLVLGKNHERARSIYEATGATVSPIPPNWSSSGNNPAAISIAGPSAHAVEEGRQKVLNVLLSFA